MNVFEAVKQSVTTRQAAEHYGIRVGRNGMACCPFHNDKTPSMKLDRRYHCFGCGADGDVIDFAAALYGLGKKEAAVQLAQDFGLSYEDWKPPGKAKKPKPRQKSASGFHSLSNTISVSMSMVGELMLLDMARLESTELATMSFICSGVR